MGGEQVVEKNELNVQSVTSVGNSWIICRSKSHFGRIYYFNTLTGEAAWNLSDSEVEKAKNRTKILQSQSGAEIEGCPEPKDPPMDISPRINKDSQPHHLFVPSKVYNKQIINNQFSKQTYESFGHCANCNLQNPQSALNAPGVNLSASHNCKPNVWTIPPNHQIVIAPSTLLPVVNQDQIPINNVDQPISVQNTSLPLSRRFNLMQQTRHTRNLNNNGINKGLHDNSYNRFGQCRENSPYFKKFNSYNNQQDLRQKLSARRSFSWNKSADNDHEDGDYTNRTCVQGIQIIKPEIEDITPSETDEEWLKENVVVQGTQLVLNVGPLKEIVSSGKKWTTWYLVADSNVLLNNINLINVIVQSDDQCQLMVPDYVMEELQNTSRLYNSQLMSRAHHVLQILSKQFSSGYAVMGKDPSNDFNKNHKLYDFCSKLSQQDRNVVLVSNNIQFEKYKSANNIPILTVTELKMLIGKTSVKPVPHVGGSFKDIKIIIPNDNKLVSVSKETQCDEYKHYDNSLQYKTDLKSVSTQTIKELQITNSFLNLKKTTDIGIQTDISIYVKKMDKSTITESSQSDYNNIENYNEVKKRGIQLKRNLSCQATVDNNVEKRQFRWRRRKGISSGPHNDVSDEITRSRDLSIDEIQHNNTSIKYLNNIDLLNCEGKNTSTDELNDSSETGSSCHVYKTALEKIVIEETSTSGISNSVSNIDSESMHSLKPNEQIYNKTVNEEEDKCKCAMFEVKSPAMEEYLKMNSDEWLSRFVQIMEEVLTQTLQHDPPFHNRLLPPPWTLHEATECIKKKFSNDNDVTDAANKLTSLLFKISDGKGKITKELKPAEFMEMYSYGVYLVDTLQTVLSSCEDLETAADSLAKLLSDIEDPNRDTSHVDSFMETDVPDASVTPQSTVLVRNQQIIKDQIRETIDLGKTITSEEVLHNEKSPKSPSCGVLPNNKKYNLRSASKAVPNVTVDKEEVVKFIRNIDVESTFFSSLKLQKNNGNSLNDNSNRCILKKKEKACPFQDTSNIDQEKVNPNSKNEINDNKYNNEQKVIRNFKKCLEFEEKLKSKGNDLDKLNYFEQADEIEDGEIVEGQYYDEDYNYDYDYYYEEPIEENDDNSIFDQIIGKLVNEIQEALLQVHSFCKKTREELSVMSNIASPRKCEIRDKAEKARSHMELLCKTLNSIMCREDTDCGKNMQAVLKEAGIHLDIAKSDEYRGIVSKYSHQANILLDAVNVIIEAVE